MKTSSFRLVSFALASVLLALFVSGCGTMRGIGHDVSHAGDHIEDAAR
jgi:predicted small secreted protein